MGKSTGEINSNTFGNMTHPNNGSRKKNWVKRDCKDCHAKKIPIPISLVEG